MASDNVLREFLVSLSYRVDQVSQTRMTRGLAATTNVALSLGKALAALSAAAVLAAAKVGQHLDELYFQSQRTQAAAASIKAMGYAVSQLGGSYQSAIGSLEAFSAKLRQNPGYESLVRQLGVVTRQNGRLRDTAEILQDVATALRSKPYYVAFQYAQALGLDEATFRALQSGELKRYLDEYAAKARQLGIDQQQAAKNGNAFWTAMREVGATLELVGQKMATELLPSMTEVVKQFDQFLQKNADKIVEFFRRLGELAVSVATGFGKLLEVLTPLWQGFDELSRAITGQDGVNAALLAMATLIGVNLIGKIASLIGLVSRLRIGWLLLAGAVISDLMKTPEQRKAQLEESINSNPDVALAHKIKGGVMSGLNWIGGKIGLRSPGDPSGGQAAGGAPRNKLAAAKESYTFWRSKGLTHEQALGVVANEMQESGFNPRARGDNGSSHGLYQWQPPRRRAILNATGIDVSTADANQQREAAYWESTQGRHDPQARRGWHLLRQAKTPGEAAAIWSQFFERPAAAWEGAHRGRLANALARQISNPDRLPLGAQGGAVSPALPSFRVPLNPGTAGRLTGDAPLAPNIMGDTSVSLQQKTEITVIGATDPSGTAQAIGEQQRSVNAGLSRNIQGAVR